MQNGKMVKEIIALQKSFFNGLFEVAAVYQDQTIKFNGILGKKMGLSQQSIFKIRHKLESIGVIKGYMPIIDFKKIGISCRYKEPRSLSGKEETCPPNRQSQPNLLY